MSWHLERLAITLGAGRAKPQGRAVPLQKPGSKYTPAEALTLYLERTNGDEAWWSPAIFRGNYRHGDNWLASSAAVCDVDCLDRSGAHVVVPQEVRQWAHEALVMRGEDLAGLLAHDTPRGLRIISVYQAPIVDRDTQKGVLLGLSDLVAEWLDGTGLAAEGLTVDANASEDVCRFFWCPCALVDGHQRAAQLHALGGAQ